MANSIQDTIKDALQAADGLYHRLVVLLGASGTGKSAALRAVGNELGSTVINVNLALSAGLLELTPKQRTLHLPALLQRLVADAPSPVLLDNMEILFDTALKQDPLRLLQGVARNRAVVVSWNGSMSNGKLTYAEPGHPEYRSYALGETLVIGMDGRSTLDMAPEMVGVG